MIVTGEILIIIGISFLFIIISLWISDSKNIDYLPLFLVVLFVVNLGIYLYFTNIENNIKNTPQIQTQTQTMK